MRINILGSGPGWDEVPPDKGQIWGVNNTHLLRNVDLIVDIHNRVNPKEEKDQVHMNELRDKMIPTYARDVMDGFPNVMRYPIESIIEEFDTDYFGSGIDYIIALAIYSGATEIHTYGVCMMIDSEYSHQKASVEFWVGMARGRGIKFRVHGDASEILQTRNHLMYGYQTLQRHVKKRDPHHLTLNDLVEMYE